MISVRPARNEDAPEAIEIIRDSIIYLCVADHQNDEATLTRWLANKTADTFTRWLSDPDNFCVVAEEDDRLLGVGDVHRRGEILLFYLKPGFQRQGIGGMIHDALERKAIMWRLPSLRLHSTSSARSFYMKMGYQPEGEAVSSFGQLITFPYSKELR